MTVEGEQTKNEIKFRPSHINPIILTIFTVKDCQNFKWGSDSLWLLLNRDNLKIAISLTDSK